MEEANEKQVREEDRSFAPREAGVEVGRVVMMVAWVQAEMTDVARVQVRVKGMRVGEAWKQLTELLVRVVKMAAPERQVVREAEGAVKEMVSVVSAESTNAARAFPWRAEEWMVALCLYVPLNWMLVFSHGLMEEAHLWTWQKEEATTALCTNCSFGIRR